ncbi:FAD/NAD(P)-binding domain-containing protein [Stipitochalara longipes BDJ]|nr:FAD/NAD(P)-binding domain-containing protein [Stipitochalara longipes BDJ]
MSSPHILIIGGGIGGLALAQGLKKHSISFTLFERDPSPSTRAQGYRIRIADIGAKGLHYCLDDELWSLYQRTCAEGKGMGSRINAIDGSKEPMFRRGGGPGGSGGPRGPPVEDPKWHGKADRTMLRALLLLGIEENVKFGKTFTKYEATDSGVTVFFSGGTSESGTLLVGAEGVTSAVRKQLLPHHRYVDTGSRMLYGKTLITPELEERFAPEAMRNGITVIQDSAPLTLFLEPTRFPNDASVESQGRIPKTEDYMYWVLSGSADNVGLSDSEIYSLTGREAADWTMKLTEKWLPSFRCLFELQTPSQCAPLRLISAKPERPEWKPSARVTLLGDAAHAMMPAGGSGAKCALSDAALLLKLIVEEGVSEEMMGKYIEGMWEYSLPAIQQSAMAAQSLLGFKGWENAKEVDL